MKTSTFLICLFAISLLPLGVNAQKLKDERIEFVYTRHPSKILPDDFKTYSVRVYGASASRAGLNTNTLAKSIRLKYYKLIENAQEFGHLRLSINTADVDGRPGKLETRTHTNKGKDGKETKSYTYYYTIHFNSNPSWQLVDPEGNILASNQFPTNVSKELTNYKNPGEASNNYKSDASNANRKFCAEISNSVVDNAATSVSKLFDYEHMRDYKEIYFIKDHETEEDFKKNMETCQNFFKTAPATMDVQEAKKTLAEPLAFWRTHAVVDPTNDKKKARIFEAASYNLALVSYYLDDFETAAEYANKLIAAEGKHRKAKDILEDIEKLKPEMERTKVYTIHHTRDLTNALPPSTVKKLEEEKQQLADENNSSQGKAIRNGETITGTVLVSKASEDLVFGPSGNIRFVVEDNGKMEDINLIDDNISEFQIGDRNYKKIRFSPSAKGKAEATICILEEVFISNRIKLYKYYPVSGSLGGEKVEYAFQKSGEDFPISLYESRFLLWKKGLAEYFKDCPDLAAMSEAGEIQLVQEDLIKAARIYAELCQEP